jgi:2-keto-4-pentenoate hydratase
MTDAFQPLAARIAGEISARADFVDCGADLADIAAAYDAQDAVRALLAPRRGGLAGRKIAWNGPGQADALGLPGPAIAPVYQDLVLAAPARLIAADWVSFFFEPEIAAVLGADIPPRDGGYASADMASFIARLHPAFELMDRRHCGNPSPFSAIANGVFNEGLVLGGPGLPPADVDLGALRSVVRLNGEVILDRTDGAPMHPFEAAARIATHASSRGETLRAGDILLCGAHLAPQAEPGPATLEFDLGPLGAARLELT